MKTLVFLTGASRGFGRCLALDFCTKIQGDLHFHLWARNVNDLAETEKLIQAAWEKRSLPGEVHTVFEGVDLGEPSAYIPKLDVVLEDIKKKGYDRLFIIHNAGSLGELCFTQEWTSHAMLQHYFEFNVTSVLWINKRFLEVFGPSRHELDQARSATVTDPTSQGYTCELIFVNISSLCALEPFLTNGLYCTGKAAREMHHRAIALEQKATPRVKTLNYSPGPMDTDMQSCFRVSKTVHSELKKIFTTMKENGTLVPPNESSYICVDLLLENSYESGAHVDYYDIVGLARDHYKE